MTPHRLVLFILQEETSQLKHGIAGKPVAIIFYGTTHVCKAFIILLWYIDDWVIKQVCQVMLLAKSLTKDLVTALSTEYFNCSTYACRDRASVNNVAMMTASVIFSCMSCVW